VLVNSVRARVAYVVTLSLVTLVGLAAPAAAATAAPAVSGSAVLADEQFKWFYWIGFVLAASLALWLLATLVGYYFRVIRPKHRGRETS
jgi:ABC-type nickel/cobalt efflux system permease component RcnA